MFKETPSVAQIAAFLGGELIGEADRVITGVAPLAQAGEHDLSFYDNERYLEEFRRSKAGVILVGPKVDPEGKTVIRVENPYLAFARVLEQYVPPAPCPFEGISPQAFVSPKADIGKDVRIAPCVYVGPEAVIGDSTVLWPGVSIGPRTRVGSCCCFYPGVVVYHDCTIGDRVILHAGCVIGADGFGFAPDGERYRKIPQIGTVVIEDDVEIGANTTVDRATLGETRIGRGTKIDNLVMVAHNCAVGENSILVAQVGISGSTVLGRHVVLAGQVGVSGHLRIGDYVQVGAKSGVTKDVPSGQLMLGAPAMVAPDFKRLQAHVRMLPEFRQQLKRLEAEIKELRKRLEEAQSGGELPHG